MDVLNPKGVNVDVLDAEARSDRQGGDGPVCGTSLSLVVAYSR